MGGIYKAFVFLVDFLTVALTCEQARGKYVRNGRGDCEGSRENRAHSGYNSMLILSSQDLIKVPLPLLLTTTEASLRLAEKERALGPN